MVQDNPYDFKQNNDFGSDWCESIKLSEAAKVVKEPKVKGKKWMVEGMDKGKADGIDKEKGKVKVRDGYSTSWWGHALIVCLITDGVDVSFHFCL